jgi:molybdopterin/thiamine biosynthesis adenylyltransferase
MIGLIRQAATAAVMPDGTAYWRLDMERAQMIAQRCGCSCGDVDIMALQEKIIPEKYSRNRQSIRCDQQIRLLQSAAAIVGLGGLGGSVTEMLARIGVGRLTLIDADRFEESNLNRQALCTRIHLGRLKAEAAGEQVAAINASITPTPLALRLDALNARALLAGHQVVVDCLDNIADRFVVEKACRENAIPLVSGAVAGFCGQLTVVFPRDKGLAAVYGNPDGSNHPEGVETSLGNLSFTVNVMAGLQCAEVINILLTGDSPLRNRLLVMDLSDATVEVVAL